MAKERGFCDLLLPAVRGTEKYELAHEIPQTRTIFVCLQDDTEGSKNKQIKPYILILKMDSTK